MNTVAERVIPIAAVPQPDRSNASCGSCGHSFAADISLSCMITQEVCESPCMSYISKFELKNQNNGQDFIHYEDY